MDDMPQLLTERELNANMHTFSIALTISTHMHE